MEVPAVRTPATAQDIASTIAALWPSIVGGTPSQAAITMLTAQTDLETGSWTKMWNWNVGNLAGMGGDYVMLHAYTGAYRPYRAFTSLEDGTRAFLSLLNVRYGAALQAAQAGDLPGFASALKAKGYYEEPEADYESALAPRYTHLASVLGTTVPGFPQPAPAPAPAPTPASSFGWPLAILGGLALGGAAYAFEERRKVVAWARALAYAPSSRRPVRGGRRRRAAA